MKGLDTKEFETLLLRMKTELESSIARLREENESVATTDDAVDVEDGIALENENRHEIALLRQQERELKEVEHALAKIANGTYGICEASGDAIPVERLRAMPHARHCIKHQRKAER